jgi:hypothetical protein
MTFDTCMKFFTTIKIQTFSIIPKGFLYYVFVIPLLHPQTACPIPDQNCSVSADIVSVFQISLEGLLSV